MSSILSNTDVLSTDFNAFHSFEGFAILGIELPQTLSQENFGQNTQWTPEDHRPVNKPENFSKNSSQKSSPKMFGKGQSMIEFFYAEEKKVIKVDSSIVIFDDYEIF